MNSQSFLHVLFGIVNQKGFLDNRVYTLKGMKVICGGGKQ